MFHENSCGCIWSIEQGRVRICSEHRTETHNGYGSMGFIVLKGKTRNYPANGQMVAGWNGR